MRSVDTHLALWEHVLMYRYKNAFTLVELLVVVAIIAILVALLLPAVNAAREAARMTKCKSNTRQIGLALLAYESANRTLPSGWTANEPEGQPGWSWSARMLPFIEEQSLYESLDLRLPISHDEHALARGTFLPVFSCPSDPSSPIAHLQSESGAHLWSVARSNFVGVFGSNEVEDEPAHGNGVLFFNSSMPLQKIKDGLSQTFFVGERSSRLGASLWIGVISGVDESMGRVVGTADHPPNDHGGHFDDFSSHHPTGAHFTLGDGSVRLITDEIDPVIYQALATRAGDERIEEDY